MVSAALLMIFPSTGTRLVVQAVKGPIYTVYIYYYVHVKSYIMYGLYLPKIFYIPVLSVLVWFVLKIFGHVCCYEQFAR